MKEKKQKKFKKKNINWTKLFTRAIIWLMLLVMVAFFVSSIVWGLN